MPGTAHIIGKVTQTAKGQNEEVNLLHKLPLTRLVVGAEILLQLGLEPHGCRMLMSAGVCK